MDAAGFDRLTRALTDVASRRTMLGTSLGGTLGALLGLHGGEAGKRRKKKRCKKRCGECERCKQGKCKPKPPGAACGNGGVCEGRECVCPIGEQVCGEACVDVLTNAAHCGACDTPCPAGQSCLHGTCTCDPFNNTCPTEIDGQCTCGAVAPETPFQAACVDRNSACDLDRPCETSDDCPPRSVCLRGCADPPAPNPNRCSNPCTPV